MNRLEHPTHIVVHHSLTQDTKTVSWAAIRKYHTQDPAHLWSDIGYHAGVELAGEECEVLLGRPWDLEGAHCKAGGMNNVALGVCCVGNYDLVPPTEVMLDVLARRVLLPWMRMFGIAPSGIVFHRDYANDRTCPGRMFTKTLLARHVPGIIV